MVLGGGLLAAKRAIEGEGALAGADAVDMGRRAAIEEGGAAGGGEVRMVAVGAAVWAGCSGIRTCIVCPLHTFGGNCGPWLGRLSYGLDCATGRCAPRAWMMHVATEGP